MNSVKYYQDLFKSAGYDVKEIRVRDEENPYQSRTIGWRLRVTKGSEVIVNEEDDGEYFYGSLRTAYETIYDNYIHVPVLSV